MMRITLAVAMIALVFTIRDIGVRTLGTYLRRIGWWWFAVIPMEILCTALDAVTIQAFASPDKIKLRHTLLAQLAGRAVNAVTPSGNLGEVVKMSVLTDFVSQSRAVATILLYNVVSFSVELLIIAAAVPVVVITVPMPTSLRVVMIVTGVICLAISIGLYALVRRGMLTSLASGLLKLRILSPERYLRWEIKLRAVDDKLRYVEEGRSRDRWLGIATSFIARCTSMALSLLILHAVGRSITAPFVAVWIVSSFVIYFASTIVPMGVGISEGGYYSLFRAVGDNPARGVALVIARRCVTVCYATLGLVLVTTSETVKRARAKQAAKVPAAEPALQPLLHPPVRPFEAARPITDDAD